jgi:PPM family protein phosphatase
MVISSVKYQIMQIHVQAISDIGCVRANNEDHILVVNEVFTDSKRVWNFNLDNGGLFLAVADGMGGHNGGEVASRMVLESLKNFGEDLQSDFKPNGFKGRMEQWISDVHSQLLQEGRQKPSLHGMGTTLAGMWFFDQGAHVFNAGDSRVYAFMDEELHQLTTDHTVGRLTGHWGPRAKQLVNCIGAIPKARIEVEAVTNYVKPQSVFLICSDGLTDLLTDDEIKAFLQPLDCKQLVAMAKDKGGRDNISVIGVEIISV